MLGMNLDQLGLLGLQLMKQANPQAQDNGMVGLLSNMSSFLGNKQADQTQSSNSVPSNPPQQYNLSSASASNPNIPSYAKNIFALMPNSTNQINPMVGQNTPIQPTYSAPMTASQPMSPMPTQQAAPPQQIQSNEMLQNLQKAAQSIYPDNPTMQQVAITQAIHESGLMNKPSSLATKYNNYFGIKSPNGARLMTTEYTNNTPSQIQDSFAVNPNMSASFEQYKKLMSNRRYAPVASAQSPAAAFAALQRAGYATDPRYASKLNSVYNRYVRPIYPA